MKKEELWTATHCVGEGKAIIPCSWSSDSEGAVAHCWTSCRWHDKIDWWHRELTTSWFHAGDRADSTVRTRVHTDKPLRTACTECTETSTTIEGPQVVVW